MPYQLIQRLRKHWEIIKIILAIVVLILGFSIVFFSSELPNSLIEPVRGIGYFLSAVAFVHLIYELFLKKTERDMFFHELSRFFEEKLPSFPPQVIIEKEEKKDNSTFIQIINSNNSPQNNLESILTNSKYIGFIAIALSNIVPIVTNRKTIDLLKNQFILYPDFKFYFYFLDPDGDAAKLRNKELNSFDVPQNIKVNAKHIYDVKQKIIKEISEPYKKRVGDNFQIYYYDVMPKIAVAKVDEGLYVSPYFLGEKGSESILLKPKKGCPFYEKCIKYYNEISKNYSRLYKETENS